MTSLTTTRPTTGTTDEERIERIRQAAYRIRRNALDMGEVQGQGYIGQALGVADVLAVVYTDQLRYRPEDPHWPDRDRFLLSIGHYAIALYAALAEAGTIPVEELETYGSDDSRLPMSAMACAHHGLDNVTAIVDVNALQADGPTAGVLRTEPVTDKWRAFGWHALRVDGNDVAALVDALDELRAHRGSPGVLICDTRIGCGVPLLEGREKAHFMRIEENEWQTCREQLTAGYEGKASA